MQLSHFNERKTEIHEKDRGRKLEVKTMIVRNASILDTGSYSCVLVGTDESKTASVFNVEYIFVHPPLRHNSNGTNVVYPSRIL